MILDEATSAIDIKGEKIVQAALDAVSKGRTTITIAHRLSTIMKADNIIVLQKGQVVEQGTHHELLAKGEGTYCALVNAQNSVTTSSAFKTADELEFIAEKQELYSPQEEKFRSVDLEAGARSNLLVATPTSSVGSFRLFLWEQRHQWISYSVMLFGSLGAGGKHHLWTTQNYISDFIMQLLSRCTPFFLPS